MVKWIRVVLKSLSASYKIHFPGRLLQCHFRPLNTGCLKSKGWSCKTQPSSKRTMNGFLLAGKNSERRKTESELAAANYRAVSADCRVPESRYAMSDSDLVMTNSPPLHQIASQRNIITIITAGESWKHRTARRYICSQTHLGPSLGTWAGLTSVILFWKDVNVLRMFPIPIASKIDISGIRKRFNFWRKVIKSGSRWWRWKSCPVCPNFLIDLQIFANCRTLTCRLQRV